ncbi:gamma-butyrobetaine dioxygenase [Corallococcus macrosporus]|uniref:Gamma-butyrobetaine dioxygenase n=1 Tax=Myxococcus fulvus (strain ATCC BAA-855 / HW-1) TaxID=483219 RepID=F8CDK9_MYXFH|nr:gamma-butyrobetaine dioxygenase [Corallococcus macrosporus]
MDSRALELLRTTPVTSKRVRDAQHQDRFRLGEGAILGYADWRMLHARPAFSGARWPRGVYFDAE